MKIVHYRRKYIWIRGQHGHYKHRRLRIKCLSEDSRSVASSKDSGVFLRNKNSISESVVDMKIVHYRRKYIWIRGQHGHYKHRRLRIKSLPEDSRSSASSKDTRGFV